MTCQECELALGMDQNVDDHLAVCASCRELVEEMRSNAMAFESFVDDPLPSVRYRVMGVIRSQSSARRVMRWGWALAAAAILVVMFAVSRGTREQTRPPVQISHVEAPLQNRERKGADTADIASKQRAPRPKRIHNHAAHVVSVKMLTSDPDVVIYWQIESEDGEK
jgi:predicted anti-sigma-YlaC factor YlaD